jgi:hypothetical protein
LKSSVRYPCNGKTKKVPADITIDTHAFSLFLLQVKKGGGNLERTRPMMVGVHGLPHATDLTGRGVKQPSRACVAEEETAPARLRRTRYGRLPGHANPTQHNAARSLSPSLSPRLSLARATTTRSRAAVGGPHASAPLAGDGVLRELGRHRLEPNRGTHAACPHALPHNLARATALPPCTASLRRGSWGRGGRRFRFRCGARGRRRAATAHLAPLPAPPTRQARA